MGNLGLLIAVIMAEQRAAHRPALMPLKAADVLKCVTYVLSVPQVVLQLHSERRTHKEQQQIVDAGRPLLSQQSPPDDSAGAGTTV